MYSQIHGLVLGFHGCDQSTAEQVLAGKEGLKRSENSYDWLGSGIYFWENSPARAMEYARELSTYPRKSGPVISKPAVVGAIIDLGLCLNLLDSKNLDLVREAYQCLKGALAGMALPVNKAVTPQGELLRRDLDCAVINTLHATRQQENLPAFDTVRSAFIEGQALYPGAGFSGHNHIQICACNTQCIKGFFRPIPSA